MLIHIIVFKNQIQIPEITSKKGNTSYPTQVTLPTAISTKQNVFNYNNKNNKKSFTNINRPMTSSSHNINSYYRFQEPNSNN